VIALGLTVEAIAVGLLVVGVLVGEALGSPALWSAIVVALLGLAITTVGVQRARPPRRPLTLPVAPMAAADGGEHRD
jgi:hypothetical protein